MYSIERKAEIMNLLSQNSSLSVDGLAERFQVSKETIRRDLRQMEKDGSLVRTHGGAVPSKKGFFNQLSSSSAAESHITAPAGNTAQLPEAPVNIRGMVNTELKRRLCKAAASYIQSGDTIYVDNSSTPIFIPQYVSDYISVTFITNSILFLTEAAKYNKPNQTVICLGGIFKGSNLSTYGNITTQNASDYFPNKTFLSCTGITALRSITDSGIEEVIIKKQMINCSKEVFVLADHTKFEQDGQIFLSSFDHIDYVITDRKVDSVDYSFITNGETHLLFTD